MSHLQVGHGVYTTLLATEAVCGVVTRVRVFAPIVRVSTGAVTLALPSGLREPLRVEWIPANGRVALDAEEGDEVIPALLVEVDKLTVAAARPASWSNGEFGRFPPSAEETPSQASLAAIWSTAEGSQRLRSESPEGSLQPVARREEPASDSSVAAIADLQRQVATLARSEASTAAQLAAMTKSEPRGGRGPMGEHDDTDSEDVEEIPDGTVESQVRAMARLLHPQRRRDETDTTTPREPPATADSWRGRSERTASGRRRGLPPLEEAPVISEDKAPRSAGLAGLLEGCKNPSDAIQMLLLMELQKRNGGGRGIGSGSESDAEAGGGNNKVTRTFDRMSRMRARRLKDPARVIKEGRRHFMEVLKLRADERWTYDDVWQKMPFGKFRSVGRMAFVITEALERLERGEPEIAHTTLMQGLKASHQFALDSGSWKAAWKLTLLGDPYQGPEFGGDPSELTVVGGYLKAADELRERVRQGAAQSGGWQARGAPKAENDVDGAEGEKVPRRPRPNRGAKPAEP